MFASIACEKWLKETIFAVPAVLITGSFASDVTPIGTGAAVTAETLRFQVAVISEGQSYAAIVAAAVAMHGEIHSSHNNQVTHPDLAGIYFVSCERRGELPMRRLFANDDQGGVHYVQLGGEYELEVTQGG